MNNSRVVEIKDVSKMYKLYKTKHDRLKDALFPFGKKRYTDFYSVRNLSLELNKGDILGVVGRNGSGKSTLMKLVSGVITPTSGKIKVNGYLVPLLELGSGFHPDFTGYENIFFYTALLGYPKKKIRQKAEEIMEFADIGEFIDQPFKNYSSGMKARLAFAVSVNIEPDILILDEVLSVGDADFKKRSYEKVRSFFEAGKTIFYVSHSMDSVVELCNRAILMDKGEIILESDPQTVSEQYEHLLTDRKNHDTIRQEILKMNQDIHGIIQR